MNSFLAPMTPFVKKLMILNIAIWLILQVIVENMFLNEPLVTRYLAFIPFLTLKGYLWQPITYMFLHSVTGISHILFNMLSLWWFGSELETKWGTKKFFSYYLICGVGAAAIYLLGMYGAYYAGWVNLEQMTLPVVGASGAIFGLLVAYGLLYGDRTVYFFGAFPLKARQFVMILGGIEVASLLISQGHSNVANLAHLGGIVTGYIYIKMTGGGSGGRTRKAAPKFKSKLKLVVDNSGKQKDDNPRYWN